MSLAKQLQEYVAAAFAGLWVRTQEPDEAEREILDLCAGQDPPWACNVWDADRGLFAPGQAPAPDSHGNPMAPLKSTRAQGETTLTLLHNYHKFLTSPVVLQALFNAVVAGKQERKFFVVLSHAAAVPPELEKVFVVLEHPLPDTFELENIANDLDPSTTGTAIFRDAAGLTRYEAEGAFALSIARHGAIRPEAVWEVKEGMLKKSGLLTLHRGGEKFSDLGGLDALKAFTARALHPKPGPARPKGVLLLGVPGTGKSAFAKALGNEAGRPTLCLDVGGLLGSLVGQTEENVRRALQVADAMSPCVLFLDEVEKALAGSTSEH